MSSHDKEILQQFKKQAQDFSNKNLSLNSDKYIQWLLSDIHLDKNYSVLEVAAGTGIFSRAMAPFVSQITSLDLSPDMIAQGRLENEQKDIHNIRFVEGQAEKLPFENSSFDVVVCRLAFHHFTDPQKVLSEMVRVGKQSSTIAVMDMVSPKESTLHHSYNHYEILRDPSHVKALKRAEFVDMYEKSDINILASEALAVEKNVEDWLSLSKTEEKTRSIILQALRDELTGGKETGLSPFYKEEKLMFYHTYFKIIGQIE